MAFDGITIAALTNELNTKLKTGRITKISQPEKDELMLTIKVFNVQYRLTISSDASLPLMYLADENKPSPLTAPNFCMVLRKHLNNAKILSITQPSLERIININLEHYDEMGDLCNKTLVVELMGKHSNIIFIDSDNKIVDSIKRISANVSSLREVLPGRPYFIPDSSNKKNPLASDFSKFKETLTTIPESLSKGLLKTYTGISPIIAEEICYKANIDSSYPCNTCDEATLLKVYNTFNKIMTDIKNMTFSPSIYYENGKPKDFSSIPLSVYSDLALKSYDSISLLLNDFYKEKNAYTRIRQKSVDLRKIVTTMLEKDYKKFDLQSKQLKDTEKKDKYQLYGEMITAYAYTLSSSEKQLICNNYYTNEELIVPLDPTITPMENSKKYFERYNKLKRTAAALESIVIETKQEIEHLESITNALDIATSEDDLKEIKEELIISGYIRRKSTEKKAKYKSKPMHFISSDGFHIYVGKNNIQNEEITFKLANGGDWWFHSKTFPGSHVIVKTEGRELPDRTFEEAARIAAHYSKGNDQDKVEIDYIERKHVKKVAGAKPGFVIYHTNYSMAISPDISGIETVE